MSLLSWIVLALILLALALEPFALAAQKQRAETPQRRGLDKHRR
jgi:hypothetical protein